MFRQITSLKTFLLALVVASAAVTIASGTAHAQVSVRGYTRSDGTYVNPHIRSYPDGNPYNNYGAWR